MSEGGINIILLKDMIDLFERFASFVWLTDKERVEIIDKVNAAIYITENVFGQRIDQSRLPERNEIVAKAWSEAGAAIRKYLPDEHIGIYLQNKSEAWQNPSKWSSDELEDMGLNINDIKSKILLITNKHRLKIKPFGFTY